MADYININGNNIPIRASDPSNPIVGEVWYNSTTNALKGQGFVADSWATGNNLNAKHTVSGSFGSQTSGIIAAGLNDATGIVSASEEYDGTNWTSNPSVNNGRYGLNGGAGDTAPAGRIAGGQTGPTGWQSWHESWNGSAWTSDTAMPVAISYTAMVGTDTAALTMGGINDPGAQSTTLEWTTSSWTSGGTLNTARYMAGGLGIQTAAICATGQTPTRSTVTESYDGTSWTNENPTNGPNMSAVFAFGTQAAGVICGGEPISATTYKWDGVCWSTSPASMNVARWQGGQYGTNSAGMIAGGEGGAPPPAYKLVTEEWTGAAPATVTFSSS